MVGPADSAPTGKEVIEENEEYVETAPCCMDRSTYDDMTLTDEALHERMLRPLPAHFRTWPASMLLTDPSLGEFVKVVLALRQVREVRVQRARCMRRLHYIDFVQMWHQRVL